MTQFTETIERLKRQIDDFADQITTCQVSTKPLDPLLHTLSELPLVNIVESRESWRYHGSFETVRDYPIQMELYCVVWDFETQAGQDYFRGLLENVRSAIHHDPTVPTARVALSLSIVESSPRQGDDHPRYVWDITVLARDVEDQANG